MKEVDIIIMNLENKKQCDTQIDQSLINQVNENTLIIEVLLEDTHKAGG